jgi:hypothetical protein
VAVDGVGNAVTTTAPTSGWTVARIDTSITEPSPYGGGPGLLRGVSCPAVSLCVAVDSVGNLVASGAPTGGSGAWAVIHIDNNSDYGCTAGGLTCQAPLMGISCPTVSLCAAVDFTGNVLQTPTPVAPTPWPSEPAGGGGPLSLWSVSCPTTGFCAAVDGIGGDVITWNPSAGPGVAVHRLPIAAFGIWCSSASLCLASGEGAHGTAELVGSINPAAKSPTWTITDYGDVNGVACPTPSVCLAADNEGELIVGVTVASLTDVLRHEATGGRIPKLGALARRRGYTFPFTSPIAGRLTITWETHGRVPTVLATGSAAFAGPQKETVKLRLTGAGRALLAGGGRVRVTAVATYVTNTGAVTSERKLTLR